ncbi:phospholipase B1, membrane-associated-like [Haliotis rubra]|uniref:phospholipase B1, membrane-associated-like n=1 Tax=Haliotis rubra TaxID=36100 RepID=UPI001EE4F8C2|nr:phospholipase B1, membrane-associated-like [Haliotis rubra]
MVESHMKAYREAERTSPLRSLDQAGRNFGCPGGTSPSVPTSVHALRAGDIKVVAALGDSLTAANGADAWTILGCLTEYRGTSWSIGGDRSITSDGITVANILRYFNPNVYGFSNGQGDRDSANKRFNVAKSGDKSMHMPEQADLLVQRLRNDPNINFQNDWKLITIFIGGNDLCQFCADEPDHTAVMYASRIEQALQILYDNVPRALVQVVNIFDIGPLTEMGGFICSTVHVYACDCLLNQAGRDKASILTLDYQRETEKVVSSSKFHNHEDFTVVLQPFLEDADPPRKSDGNLDTAFFAPDCFHFSRMGHQMVAKNLWNAMFQPVGMKDRDWDMNVPIYCPKENEFIATEKNSRR